MASAAFQCAMRMNDGVRFPDCKYFAGMLSISCLTAPDGRRYTPRILWNYFIPISQRDAVPVNAFRQIEGRRCDIVRLDSKFGQPAPQVGHHAFAFSFAHLVLPRSACNL